MNTTQNQNAKTNGTTNIAAVYYTGGIFNAKSLLATGVKHMGLFGSKNNTKELPPLISDAELTGADYNQVLDFLISVNDADFDKIVDVAKVYRKAHTDVAGITGLTNEQVPSIFDHQAQPALRVTPPDTEAGDFLTDDDDKDIADFLNDTEPTQAPETKAPTTPGGPNEITVVATPEKTVAKAE